jgi:nucleoside 2-deoxyribosyltransferase
MKIYLAGGMRSGWQDKVKEAAPNATYLDPTTKCEDKMCLKEIFNWDLARVYECDVIFAYIERDNPSCIGTSFELGSAYGQKKTIILVLEDENEHIKDKYLQFLTPAADLIYKDLDTAINFLKTLTEE